MFAIVLGATILWTLHYLIVCAAGGGSITEVVVIAVVSNSNRNSSSTDVAHNDGCRSTQDVAVVDRVRWYKIW
jgi:hypothetical protein